MVITIADANISALDIKDLDYIRIASRWSIFGVEATEAIADGKVSTNSVFGSEGDIIEGIATKLYIKNNTTTKDKVDEDDIYGT